MITRRRRRREETERLVVGWLPNTRRSECAPWYTHHIAAAAAAAEATDRHREANR